MNIVPFDIVADTDRVVIFHRPDGSTQRLELSNREAMELAEQLMKLLRRPRTDYQRHTMAAA